VSGNKGDDAAGSAYGTGRDPSAAVAAALAAGARVTSASTIDYFAALPAFPVFASITEPASYTALPDDWTLGLADVVTSTQAIAAGRYKAVNTAGAAVISAVSNALRTLDFPFVFTGDGASFAVGPRDAERACAALAATVAWVGAALDLELRGAAVPVREIRAAGFDLKVARFAASEHAAYAMFTGGGRDWAERQLKAGLLHLPPAPAGARPDLTGLSCRFSDIRAANGTILSVIVKPVGRADDPRFVEVVGAILDIVGHQPRAAHPVPSAGPPLHWPPSGFDMEARLLNRKGWPLAVSRVMVAARTLVAHIIISQDIKIGSFSPELHRRQMVENSDFRKFDDGLMMTIDCSLEAATGIESRLTAAEAAGVARFGLHRQPSALVTCMVPSTIEPDHIHFVDGAAGGYTLAARDLKRKQS